MHDLDARPRLINRTRSLPLALLKLSAIHAVQVTDDAGGDGLSAIVLCFFLGNYYSWWAYGRFNTSPFRVLLP